MLEEKKLFHDKNLIESAQAEISVNAVERRKQIQQVVFL